MNLINLCKSCLVFKTYFCFKIKLKQMNRYSISMAKIIKSETGFHSDKYCLCCVLLVYSHMMCCISNNPIICWLNKIFLHKVRSEGVDCFEIEDSVYTGTLYSASLVSSSHFLGTFRCRSDSVPIKKRIYDYYST